MSYEIVKNCSVLKDKESGKWYARIKSASNNVRPLHYCEWTLGLDEQYNYTKEELEKILLLEFLHGNLQRGSSRYRKTVIMVKNHHIQLLNRYYRLDRCIDNIRHRHYKLMFNDNRTPLQEHRYQQINKLSKKLYDMRDREAKEVLYKFMIEHKDIITNKDVRPYTIQHKYTGEYVTKVTKRSFFTSAISTEPHIFKSRALWERINSGTWWKERFNIVQL